MNKPTSPSHAVKTGAPDELDGAESEVRRLGREAGFASVRIASASPLHIERARYLQWVKDGRQGDMRWITRDHVERSAVPGRALVDARSVVSVAYAYGRTPRPASSSRQGAVARYAWGPDYHAAMGNSLQRLVDSLQSHFGGEYCWYVDTGPQMDKALAVRAGVGWYGKNTNVLTQEFGSYVLLGEVITTLELKADERLDQDCGSCRLCQVACPTGALDTEYSIDARRCISYLTIEHRGAIPAEYREPMRNWVYGCDICQDVCPPTVAPYLRGRGDKVAWIRETRAMVQPAGSTTDQPPGRAPEHDPVRSPDLVWLLTLSHADYLEAYRGTSIRRAKVWMLRRNAAVALGNVGGEEAVGPLAAALSKDDYPLVRGHAAWALGRLASRLGSAAAIGALHAAAENEQDEYVRAEIGSALRIEGDAWTKG